MRNKFSELIDKNVAVFRYKDIIHDTPTIDALCIQYNNIFGMITDTHMSVYNNDEESDYLYIITGSMIRKPEWNSFINPEYNSWKGVHFCTTGYINFWEFLYTNGLQGDISIVNNDTVYLLKKRKEEKSIASCDCKCCSEECKCFTTSESRVPQPLAELVKDRDVLKIRECLNRSTIGEVVESLNNNPYITGQCWVYDNGRLICKDRDKMIFIG